MKTIVKLFIFFCCFICGSNCYAQQLKDTIHTTKRNNIFHYALKYIKRNSTDSNTHQGLLTTKSEDAFLPYQGKIIRHILTNQYGFEKTFTDTTKKINYKGTKLLNKLHRTTRQFALEDALFIKENDTLAPYKLADNERYLRSLNYIQDARFVVKPAEDSGDSVDVYVITKDLFSLNGNLNDLSAQEFKGQFGDANLLGGAQNLQAAVLWQKSRNPGFGGGLLYSKYSVAHSFINATAVITNINPDLLDGTNDEHDVFFSLQRNLISQYSHFAGGLTAGIFRTQNDYEKIPETFFNYKYSLFDAWVGYNLGVQKFIKDQTRRDKQFLSFRYYNDNFLYVPVQIGNTLNFRYNDKEAALGQFTFFKQEYYKTNYIYGFGTTEDIPYGYNVAITSGYYRQSYLKRMYAGVDANRYVVYPKGDIVQYFLRAGGFWNDGQVQDGQVFFGASLFSRLLLFSNFKLRQYEQFSVARQFNRIGLDPLSIDNPFGVRNFRSDSVRGTQRVSLHSETFSFINYKLLGFKFSPFAFGDIVALTPEYDLIKTGWYYGVGGGVRARNENLVFRTVEARLVYFPRKAMQTNSFYATLRINIAFRYNSNYVREPDIIQVNSDIQNNVF